MQLFFFFFRLLQKRKTSDRLTQTLPQTPTEVSDLWTRCQTDRITSERFAIHRLHVDVFKSSSLPPRVLRTFSLWDAQLQAHPTVYNI